MMNREGSKTAGRRIAALTLAAAAFAMVISGCGSTPEKTFKKVQSLVAAKNYAKIYDRYIATQSKERMARINKTIKSNRAIATSVARLLGWKYEEFKAKSDREIFARRFEILTTATQALRIGPTLSGAVLEKTDERNGKARVYYKTADGRERSLTMVKESDGWKILF